MSDTFSFEFVDAWNSVDFGLVQIKLGYCTYGLERKQEKNNKTFLVCPSYG